MRYIVFAFLIGLSSIARADADADRAEAQQLKDEGAQALERGENERALELFQSAYRKFPSPNLRFNLGVVYSLLGREDEARDAFESYLKEVPEAPADARQFAQNKLNEFRAHQAARQKEKQPARPRSFGRRHLASLTLGSIALASLAVTLGTGLAAQADYDRLAQHCDPMTRICPASLSSTGHSADRLAIAADTFLAIGITAAVASAVAMVLEWKLGRPRRLASSGTAFQMQF